MTAIQYGPVGVFVAFSAAFAVAALFIAYLIRPADPYSDKLLTYECGIVPVGEAWSRFFVRYYIIALMFVIFDVEAIFMYPWAVVYRRLSGAGALGLYPLMEMGVFLSILLMGLVYAWWKGDLRWVFETSKGA